MFVTDFIDLVEKHKITILNKEKVESAVFSLRSIEKNKNDRRDCLLIDSETKEIRYFIFTYKPDYLKHYFLLENLGNDTFTLIRETICFNELFASNELINIKYKNGSELASRSFAKNRYESYQTFDYISFEEEEEFDEEARNEFEPVYVDFTKIKRDALIRDVLEQVKAHNYPLDIGVTLHGKERILQRIGEMNETEMLSLSKVAYELGLTSAHFIEKDTEMFQFLQYHQNKKQGKTLRLYKDLLVFYSLQPPHCLVTCFLYQKNYDLFREEKKKKRK